MRILSIDPGVVNLGWRGVEGRCGNSAQKPLMNVVAYVCENTTRACTVRGCTLPKTRELWDRLEHTYAHALRDHAEAADHIVLERQPPGGLGEVVSFFYSKHKGKVIRVHPRSMHAHFGISGYDYDGRKGRTEALAPQWIPELVGSMHRAHDVADAVAMAWYFFETEREPAAHVASHEWMDRFKFGATDAV